MHNESIGILPGRLPLLSATEPALPGPRTTAEELAHQGRLPDLPSAVRDLPLVLCRICRSTYAGSAAHTAPYLPDPRLVVLDFAYTMRKTTRRVRRVACRAPDSIRSEDAGSAWR